MFIMGVVVALLVFMNNSFAFQEVHDVLVVDYHIDHATDICTIMIDKDHAITSSTAQCNHKTFSWQCLNNDYRFELARHSEKNHYLMDIRYSEYSCNAETKNMNLLTVW